jgi:transcriptional regulator with XRE-family HTH domain
VILIVRTDPWTILVDTTGRRSLPANMLGITYAHPNEVQHRKWWDTVAARATERSGRLGAVLKRARKEVGYSQAVAAERFGCSQAMIHRIEVGARALMSEELARYLDVLSAGPAVSNEIAAIIALPDDPVPADLNPNPRFLEMLRAIPKATEVLTFHSEGLPAHLQSDPYILRQHELFGTRLTETEILRGRHDRLSLFTQGTSPICRAVVTESSLTRMPGGSTAIIREQARYLLELIEEVPRLSLQVLRTNAPLSHITASFTAVRMPGRTANMVYVPVLHDGYLTKDGRFVANHTAFWRKAQQAALTEDESMKLIYELSRQGAPIR